MRVHVSEIKLFLYFYLYFFFIYKQTFFKSMNHSVRWRWERITHLNFVFMAIVVWLKLDLGKFTWWCQFQALTSWQEKISFLYFRTILKPKHKKRINSGSVQYWCEWCSHINNFGVFRFAIPLDIKYFQFICHGWKP
jgi:hypothetical protein